jgi:hypothetical protein
MPSRMAFCRSTILPIRLPRPPLLGASTPDLGETSPDRENAPTAWAKTSPDRGETTPDRLEGSPDRDADAARSGPDEERNCRKHDTGGDERCDVYDEVRDRHEKHSTHEGDHSVPALAVHAIPHADAAEDQSEEEKRRAHGRNVDQRRARDERRLPFLRRIGSHHCRRSKNRLDLLRRLLARGELIETSTSRPHCCAFRIFATRADSKGKAAGLARVSFESPVRPSDFHLSTPA